MVASYRNKCVLEMCKHFVNVKFASATSALDGKIVNIAYVYHIVLIESILIWCNLCIKYVQ